jgi:hypothetical protein
MILIAALGAGIAGVRAIWLGLVEGPGSWSWYGTPARLMLASMLSAGATPMTLACLAYRLRQPRPAWRRVVIQPGAAALLACSLVFAVRMLEAAVAFAAPTVGTLGQARAFRIRISDSDHLVLAKGFGGNGVISYIKVWECFTVTVASFAWPCGYAVAAVWLVLAVSGRWRPEKSWIDWLGWVLGAIWILITVLTAQPV